MEPGPKQKVTNFCSPTPPLVLGLSELGLRANGTAQALPGGESRVVLRFKEPGFPRLQPRLCQHVPQSTASGSPGLETGPGIPDTVSRRGDASRIPAGKGRAGSPGIQVMCP